MNRFKNHVICNLYKKIVFDVTINHRNVSYLAKLIEYCSCHLKKEDLSGIVQEYLLLNYSKLKLLNGKMVNKIVSKYYTYLLRYRYLINKAICKIPSPEFSRLKRKEVAEEYKKNSSYVGEMYKNFS